MAKFSRNLEQSLHRALALANERHHEYATLEHLLLALVDDPDAAVVMRACNVDIDKLRRGLVTYVESELEGLVTDGAEDSKPTAGFHRTIQRSVIHVQASGREEVTGANVLVAIFAERESHAVFFLQEQQMTRQDAVNFISHGTAERPGLTEHPTFYIKSEKARDIYDEITKLNERLEKLKHRNDALVLFTWLLLSAILVWNIPYSQYWSVPLFFTFTFLLLRNVIIRWMYKRR